ncbi:MAG: hypothetical protein V4440_14680 [Pseudomonadota bacterium]
MSDIQYQQTVARQEEMEYLLTKEAFMKWFLNNPIYIFHFNATNGRGHLSIKQLYFKEHGLPSDSVIKGL